MGLRTSTPYPKERKSDPIDPFSYRMPPADLHHRERNRLYLSCRATSHVERIITPALILDAFGQEILLAALIIITILVAALCNMQRSWANLSLERKKFKSRFPSPETQQAAKKKLVNHLASQSSTERNTILQMTIPWGKDNYCRISARQVSR